MKRRILSIVLVLALCLAYLPVQVHAVDYEVADSDELQAALTGLANGDTIILTQDIEYGFEIGAGAAGENYTIDLNGHILSLPAVSFESPASWTITDSSGTNSGILEAGIDFSLTAATSTLTISDGAGLEVNGMFNLAGPRITMSGPNSLIWNGEVYLPDDVELIFGDTYFSIEISNMANVKTTGTLGVLALNLQDYVKDRYLLSGVTTMTVTDRTTNTDLTPPTTLTLKDWPQPTIDISFLDAPYNGAPQDLIVVEDFDDTTVEGIFYGTTGDTTSTAPDTGTDADNYPDLAYLVLGTDGYDDIYKTGYATISQRPVTIETNSNNVIYNGTTQTVEGYTIVSGSLADGDWVDGTATASGTNAGVYQNEFNGGTFTIRNASNNEVIGNYALTTNYGNLTIETITENVIVRVTDQATKVLTGPLPENAYTVYGLADADELEGTAVYEYRQSGAVVADPITNGVGEYDIVLTGLSIPAAIAANYTGTFEILNGTLTVTDLTPVSLTTAPQAIEGLVYNGQDQVLITGGTATGGTVKYNITGPADPYDSALPSGTAANEYTVYYTIEPDAEHSAVPAFDGYFGVGIEPAPPIEVQAIEHVTMTAGGAMPALYTVIGTMGTDELEIIPYFPAGDPDTTVAGGPYDFEIRDVDIHFASGTEDNYYAPYYEVMVPMGQLTVNAASSGGGGSTNEESYDFTQPSEGVGSGIMDEEAWTWSERGNMPVDIATFNMILSNNSVSEDEDNPLPYPNLGTEHFLASDDTWVLPEEDPAVEEAKVIDVRVCQDNEPIYLANGDGKVDQDTFGNSDFFTVGVGTGDTKIDYANLKTGDVVSNTSFNGVFVTKLQKSNNPTFDADLAKLKSDTIASFRAFELDHPEVFWLNGSIKLRVLTVTLGGEQTSFIFMTLVDDKGFTMRITDYAAPGAIEAAIKQRDAAVDAIIAQIPAGATTREKIVNLNKWFTLNNEYNRSADLSAIGYTPHRSLKSLMGNFGINGPVCDGYSRGFKTVCDRLGIPVVLETGTASIGTHSELHMWMSVKVDGTWYGMDTTWNDPIVKGKDGKVSGYENEKYLLVGNDTVVDGAKFGVSHPANKTPGGTTGVLFASLILNPNEIYGYVPVDYDDVNTSDWFYDYVQDVTKLNLMNGTSPNLFSPQGTATRGQIVQILYNIAGQPEVEDVKVEGWFGVPATWAMDKGIVAGYPDGDFHGNDPVTREQLATILWAFEGAPEQSGELSFADADKVSSYAINAMLWAKKEGIIGGKPGNLADPQGTATRAEIATIFSNYMK